MDSKQFIDYFMATVILSQILQNASDGKSCRFMILTQEEYETFEHPEIMHSTRGHNLLVGDWYVVVTCRNGYKYYVNVTADSIITMCIEVLKAMEFK
jgi:hypothetical protein